MKSKHMQRNVSRGNDMKVGEGFVDFESAISSITIVRVLPIWQFNVLWERHSPSVSRPVGLQ